jgi:hypothetical protein
MHSRARHRDALVGRTLYRRSMQRHAGYRYALCRVVYLASSDKTSWLLQPGSVLLFWHRRRTRKSRCSVVLNRWSRRGLLLHFLEHVLAQ